MHASCNIRITNDRSESTIKDATDEDIMQNEIYFFNRSSYSDVKQHYKKPP
jgi:hypothetical protein